MFLEAKKHLTFKVEDSIFKELLLYLRMNNGETLEEILGRKK